MYLLDTNIFTLFADGDENVLRRFAQANKPVYLSSVAAEERLAGLMSQINRARAPRSGLSLPRAHRHFTQTLETINIVPIFALTEEAEAVFKTFTKAQTRNGAQDCYIAAQALAHGGVVITRNLRHFEAIGAPCEDWSLPSEA